MCTSGVPEDTFKYMLPALKKISAAGVQGLPATPYYNSGTCAVYVKVFELEC